MTHLYRHICFVRHFPLVARARFLDSGYFSAILNDKNLQYFWRHVTCSRPGSSPPAVLKAERAPGTRLQGSDGEQSEWCAWLRVSGTYKRVHGRLAWEHYGSGFSLLNPPSETRRNVVSKRKGKTGLCDEKIDIETHRVCNRLQCEKASLKRSVKL